MRLATQVVDWGDLLRVVLTSLVAGTGVAAALSLAIYGSTRFSDLRRSNRGTAAGMHVALAAVSLVVLVGACAYGITLVLKK